MRIDIVSQDRLGISQEILALFSRFNWDLAAIEMHKFHTFVLVHPPTPNADQVWAGLLAIAGVSAVNEVELLPSERKRKHLDALVAKLPDPIVDINSEGQILIANSAAEQAFGFGPTQLEGQSITDLTQRTLAELLPAEPLCLEVSVGQKSFLTDITPVKTDFQTSGAVIIFRSPQRLGQQIDAVDPQKGQTLGNMIGQSAPMQEIASHTRRFGAVDLTVLVTGETGTGKELLARALHQASKRAKAPFLAINCATLAENLLESELFGYAPGAFTGAQRGGKPGLFELADNGTVLLDEIGEMSAYLQAKLLRFLQDLTFRRIGGANEIKVNVRIICATHRNLRAMIDQGVFREDLYYRINVVHLHLPPLRERREDIPALANAFALNASEQMDQRRPVFSEAAMQALQHYLWPGNIRQLQNVVFRTLALTDKSIIDQTDLHLPTSASQNSSQGFDYNQVNTLAEAVADFEATLLKTLLVQYPSTRKLASRLGVSHSKISRKLVRYGMG